MELEERILWHGEAISFESTLLMLVVRRPTFLYNGRKFPWPRPCAYLLLESNSSHMRRVGWPDFLAKEASYENKR